MMAVLRYESNRSSRADVVDSCTMYNEGPYRYRSVNEELVFRSRAGTVVYISMVVVLIMAIAIALILPPVNAPVLLSIMALLELYIAVTPLMTKYTFSDDSISVFVPFQFKEPPASYERVWKVVDTHHAYASLHGLSSNAIQVWYDRGTGHYLCISPKDKKRVLELLRERCPDAEFIYSGDSDL